MKVTQEVDEDSASLFPAANSVSSLASDTVVGTEVYNRVKAAEAAVKTAVMAGKSDDDIKQKKGFAADLYAAAKARKITMKQLLRDFETAKEVIIRRADGMQKQLRDGLDGVNARIEDVNAKVEGYHDEHEVRINNVELALITENAKAYEELIRRRTVDAAHEAFFKGLLNYFIDSYANGNGVQADDPADDQADDQADEEVEVDSPDVEDCEIQFIEHYLSEKAEKDKRFCWYDFYHKMFKGPKRVVFYKSPRTQEIKRQVYRTIKKETYYRWSNQLRWYVRTLRTEAEDEQRQAAKLRAEMEEERSRYASAADWFLNRIQRIVRNRSRLRKSPFGNRSRSSAKRNSSGVKAIPENLQRDVEQGGQSITVDDNNALPNVAAIPTASLLEHSAQTKLRKANEAFVTLQILQDEKLIRDVLVENHSLRELGTSAAHPDYPLMDKKMRTRWLRALDNTSNLPIPRAEEIGSKLVQVHEIMMAGFRPVEAGETSNEGTPEEKVWEEAEANVSKSEGKKRERI